MNKLHLVGIAGNLQRPSRTLTLVAEVVTAVRRLTGGETLVADVVEARPELGSIRSPRELRGLTEKVVRSIEEAGLLVVGTPVYRGSYTGLLKHLFDLLHPQALAGKPVILTATGGSSMHGLVIEHQLRPLLSFFGAHTVPTAIYATDTDFKDYRLVNAAVSDRIARSAREAARFLLAAPNADATETAIYRQIAAG
jgi:FMN reductase